MRARSSAVLFAVCAVMSTGCYSGFGANGMNTSDLQAVDFTKVSQMKRGESCATTLLSLFTEGSALITDAAKVGGIKKVQLVEYKASSNPLFSKQCTIVFGE